MAFAITQTCCNDASCVAVCPVNCIHPTPDEPGFGTAEMLYVDPRTCIDCGACADACPTEAIVPVERLSARDAVYADINRQYYEGLPADPPWAAPHFPRTAAASAGGLRVAIVGTGPSACYTAQRILRSTGAEVTMIDRVPVAGGLVRHGVAPDHPSTKRVGDSFGWIFQHPRVSLHLGVEVGTDITHAEIAAHHHAVVYAVGASSDRALGIPGVDLPGVVPAGRLVAWLNAHPRESGLAPRLPAGRAVVVGNGNVGLDVARLLLSDPDRLATTDIADHALEALRERSVREVVLVGRRGPEHAAYTRPELLALSGLPGVQLVVDDQPGVRMAIAAAPPSSKAAVLQGIPIERVDYTSSPGAGRRVVLRFHSSPTAVVGTGGVEALRVRSSAAPDTSAEDSIGAGLVVTAIGHRGSAIAGLPFDEATGTVPNDRGRVVDRATGSPVPGAYVAGWIKRGATGGIGANRTCAEETVDALVDDASGEGLTAPEHPYREFTRLIRQRSPQAIGGRGMRAIDKAERARGEGLGRPRVKFASTAELLAAARKARGARC